MLDSHRFEILAGVAVAFAAYQLFRSNDTIPTVGFFGNLEAIYLTLTKRRKEFHEKYHSKLGPIFAFGMFKTHISVSDPDENKRILTNTNEFGKEALKDIGTGYLDGSLLALETGDEHKMHRALVQPAFGPTHLKHTAVATMDTVDELAQIWQNKLSDKPFEIDVFNTMNSIAIEVMISVLFGGNVKVLGKTADEKNSMWGNIEKSVGSVMTFRIVTPKILWGVLGISRYSKQVVDMKKRLEDSMTRMVKNNDPNREGWKMNVVDRLSSALDSQKLSREQILAEMIGFFFAGQDTTANTLTFMLYELGLHPEIQQKLYNEIKDFELKDESDALRYINEFKYLDFFFKETMRMHPVVPTIVVFKDEKYYKNPESFNPDRWKDDQINPNAFQPFGDGPRNCIGQKMAVIEVKYAIVQLLKHFVFTNVEQQVEYKSVIVSSIKGVQVGVTPRELAQ
ncbi:Cytochrome P450 4d2 [Boothiomyces sp. JEL0838]|nr:Cytochrome P450 4d2 [Boothiomyces sp. JEL0838]